MIKKIFFITGIIFVLTTVFVAGDYYSLFGEKQIVNHDFIILNFKTIDEETGALVIDVKTRCFQTNNRDACTQRNSHKLGLVSINVPMQKIITKSYLFNHDSKIRETLDPKLHVMFIHPDYASPVETIYVDEFEEISKKEMVVSMPKSIRQQ
jgi:hypothetical protein